MSNPHTLRAVHYVRPTYGTTAVQDSTDSMKNRQESRRNRSTRLRMLGFAQLNC
jgi:hypothetical protein